jgi:hypothetical protein
MAIILENYDYTKNAIINDHGSKRVAPGSTLYLLMKARPASLSIITEGTSYYMISVTQAYSEKIKADLAAYLDADAIDFSASEDFIVECGGAIKIVNRPESTHSIEVDWRI